jgi:hypothetical protein
MKSNDSNYAIQLIIDAVANDYESFESITQQVQEWTQAEKAILISPEEIERGLAQAIAMGYVQAFRLSATSPPEVVKFNATEIGELSFYRTRAGLDVLEQQAERQ